MQTCKLNATRANRARGKAVISYWKCIASQLGVIIVWLAMRRAWERGDRLQLDRSTSPHPVVCEPLAAPPKRSGSTFLEGEECRSRPHGDKGVNKFNIAPIASVPVDNGAQSCRIGGRRIQTGNGFQITSGSLLFPGNTTRDVHTGVGIFMIPRGARKYRRKQEQSSLCTGMDKHKHSVSASGHLQ